MTPNMLQLHDTKTEAMTFGTPSQLKNCTIDYFIIGESNIIPSQHVKNIGVILDPQVNMKHHINMIASNAWYHIKNIYKIRKYFKNKTTENHIILILYLCYNYNQNYVFLVKIGYYSLNVKY